MKKPYFEVTRIALNEDTKEEFEYKTMLLWCEVVRIEVGVDDDSFKNKDVKTVIFMSEGSIWALAAYEDIRKAWAEWLDAANNIQSVFGSN